MGTYSQALVKKGNKNLSIECISDILYSDGGISGTPHVHPHTEIIWLIKGTGKLHLDMLVFELDINTMYFVRPGQVHNIQFNDASVGYVLSISKSMLEPEKTDMGSSANNHLLNSILDNRRICLDPNISTDIKDVVERMIREIFSDQEYSTEVLSRYFKIFLFYLEKQLSLSTDKIIQNRNSQVVQQFKNLVNQYYKTRKGVSDYASELNLTPNYLNEIIKKVTGRPAGHLIRQRIALEAKRYALHSEVCMKEIGYHLGFSDMAHFSKFFKSEVGSNFTDFKNEKIGCNMSH